MPISSFAYSEIFINTILLWIEIGKLSIFNTQIIDIASCILLSMLKALSSMSGLYQETLVIRPAILGCQPYLHKISNWKNVHDLYNVLADRQYI